MLPKHRGYISQYQAIRVSQCRIKGREYTNKVSGRIIARKPDVFDGDTSIDDWINSMKAYIEGTIPGIVMHRVRVSQIKLFMSRKALRRVKNALKDEFCDWVVLKKCLEAVFDRQSVKY